MSGDLLAWIDPLLRFGVPGGVIGSGFTAWIGWGIEKRKIRHQNRCKLIENWRGLIATLPDKGGWSLGDPTSRAFLKSEHFISLEPHLSPELLKRLRADRTITVGEDFPRRKLSEAVARLEKSWGLV
jgi:hypothetical protein